MRTYTTKELAYLLQTSVKTIRDDIAHLRIKFTLGARGAKLYKERDYQLIKQLRIHCEDKANTRGNFVFTALPEIVEEEPKVTRLTNNISSSNLAVSNLPIYSEQDPLFDLDVLQRIADNNYLLPTKRLAAIIGMSANNLSKHKSLIYCGFTLKRETKIGNKILWNVTPNNSL